MKENFVIAEKCNRNLVERFLEYMTAISRNVHVDQLESIANKYNNTYHGTIIDILTLILKTMIKILNLKLANI